MNFDTSTLLIVPGRVLMPLRNQLPSCAPFRSAAVQLPYPRSYSPHHSLAPVASNPDCYDT